MRTFGNRHGHREVVNVKRKAKIRVTFPNQEMSKIASKSPEARGEI